MLVHEGLNRYIFQPLKTFQTHTQSGEESRLENYKQTAAL